MKVYPRREDRAVCIATQIAPGTHWFTTL